MSRPKRTIALDFDGVLHAYAGYKDGLIQGPLPGAKEALEHLVARGHTVVVFSTRDKDLIRKWLQEHGFPPVEVTNVKRPFYVIVDDRAVCFEGKWTADLLAHIERFRPYWLCSKRG